MRTVATPTWLNSNNFIKFRRIVDQFPHYCMMTSESIGVEILGWYPVHMVALIQEVILIVQNATKVEKAKSEHQMKCENKTLRTTVGDYLDVIVEPFTTRTSTMIPSFVVGAQTKKLRNKSHWDGFWWDEKSTSSSSIEEETSCGIDQSSQKPLWLKLVILYAWIPSGPVATKEIIYKKRRLETGPDILYDEIEDCINESDFLLLHATQRSFGSFSLVYPPF